MNCSHLKTLWVIKGELKWNNMIVHKSYIGFLSAIKFEIRCDAYTCLSPQSYKLPSSLVAAPGLGMGIYRMVNVWVSVLTAGDKLLIQLRSTSSPTTVSSRALSVGMLRPKVELKWIQKYCRQGKKNYTQLNWRRSFWCMDQWFNG